MHVDQPASPVSIPSQPAERCGLALRDPAANMGAWVSLLRDADDEDDDDDGDDDDDDVVDGSAQLVQGVWGAYHSP